MAVMTQTIARTGVGPLLKEWRRRRHMSQLDLSLEAERVGAAPELHRDRAIAARAREMVLHLAEQLDVPLRDRNQLLLAAGYAPAYGQRDLDAPEMAPVRAALEPRARRATSRTRRSSSTATGASSRRTRGLGAADRGRRARTCSSRR